MSSIADVLSPEAKAHTAQKGSTNANGFTDYFDLDGLLTEENILVRQSIRDFVKKEISPNIEKWAQQAHFPSEIVRKFGDVGAFGPTIPQEYGGGGLDYISYGLIMQEIERGDSGMRSTASVQGSLVMFPIYQYGSEAQRQKFLPKLASGEWLGCFGLTEPDHGSNPGGMTTNIREEGDHYVLNGAKLWISNSPECQVAVVWAKNEQGRIKGVLVERGMAGFTTPEIHNKWSLRASITGELVFDNVIIPKENILPNIEGLKGPLSCLDSARFGIAWGAIGAAIDCYESALKYSLQREQFGKPIASFQLQQKKLAEMITEITKAQLLAWRLGRAQKRRPRHERSNFHGQAQFGGNGPARSPRGPPDSRRHGHHGRVPHHAPHDEPGIGGDV